MKTRLSLYRHLAEVDEVIPFLKDNGLDLEIMLLDSEYMRQTSIEDATELGARLLDEGISVSVHLPVYGLQPGCRDSVIRAVSAGTLLKGLVLAGALGARSATMHSGLHPFVPPKFVPSEMATFAEAIKPVLAIAEELEIDLAVENTHEKSPELFTGLVDWSESDRLGFCWDPAHSHCFGEVEDLEWLEPLSKRLKVVHMSDNRGDRDSHLALGEGNVPWKAIIKGLIEKGVDVPWVLELKPEEALVTFEWLKRARLDEFFELPA